MKGTFVGILQTRMDKCTTEQFWVAGADAAFSAYLISAADTLKSDINAYAVVVFALIVAVYAACFIVNRHTTFYRMSSEQVSIAKDDPDCPPLLRYEPKQNLSGVVFYIGVVLAGTIGVLVAFLGPNGN